MSAKKKTGKATVKKSRKQLRKEQRKNKKIRRNEYYTNRRSKPGQYVLLTKRLDEGSRSNVKIDGENPRSCKTQPEVSISGSRTKFIAAPLQVPFEQLSESGRSNVKIDGKNGRNCKMQTEVPSEEIRNRDRAKHVKLQKEMKKRRRHQLMDANIEEDRNIRRLGKQLKLNKRKSKSLPASFAMDGLDYLLEVCEPSNLRSSAIAEQELSQTNEEFDEDLVLMSQNNTIQDDCDSSEGTDDDNDYYSDDDSDKDTFVEQSVNNKGIGKNAQGEQNKECHNISVINNYFGNESNPETLKNSSSGTEENERKNDVELKEMDTWEDIYGRLRGKDGKVIKTNQKYILPAVRLKDTDSSSDTVRFKKLDRLKRQLKGLLNRLAESNMHNIAVQIEELYMNHSRNDMNNTLTTLILEALVSHVMTPERLLMENVLLVTILHANVGTDVGAHFLQTVVKYFQEFLTETNVENKKLDNLVIIFAQLYNFKLFDSKLVYEVLLKLSESFEEKNVECILHILRNVGFSLRKDNPIALKKLIFTLQKEASDVSKLQTDNSRIKFMLHIVLAIKNNNVSKIPNYDISYSEHLKKIMKGFIRAGNYVSQLNISLEDLLKAEENGKWWIVGSAWARNIPENTVNTSSKEVGSSFSQNLMQLAIKQRMNTDTRKNIFCVIMSAEDYLDAFEKVLRLGLKNQQERDIIHVILHCCLQEKTYNPFYATLAQKFCEYDRKHQMTIKFSIWDKIKALKDHSAVQISHLAKLLSFLLIEKGLPISILKVIQFSELDKTTLRFIRQILLGVLLHQDLEVCKGVFEKVSRSVKLKIFSERLRLFMHHFLLGNLKSQEISEDRRTLLHERIKIVDKMLTNKGFK